MSVADKFDTGGQKVIGGGEVYLQDLCHLLQKMGHETTIIQGGNKSTEFEFENIKIIQIPSRGRYWFNLEWKKAVPRDTDYVHLHDANHLFPFKQGNPTSTFHGVSWDVPYYGSNHLQYLQWWSRYKFFKTIINHAIKHSSAIVSVDNFLLRYVQSEFPNYRDNIEVIYNYADTEKFKPKKVKKGTDKKVILFPRNMSLNRGVYLMLEAFEKLNRDDCELWMVGSGPENHAVKAAAEKNKNIKMIGHKDHYKEMPEVYNQSDVVVIPSRGVEGTSLSCIEAMACGKPTIASNIGGLVDIIQHGENGLLCKTNADSLKENLEMLLGDRKMRNKLGKNARKRAEEFSRSIWEKRWTIFIQNYFK